MRARENRRAGRSMAIAVVLGFAALHASRAGAAPLLSLSTDQIVERMVAMNRARAEALRSYSSTCIYRVENGDRGRNAELVVKSVFLWPDRKESIIVSESGSSILLTRVLNRLLEGEAEAMQRENHRREEMSPQNYDFRLVGEEHSDSPDYYVLEVAPKFKDKLLLQGRIWVDARDFGIVRMEGAPAKNPSWWTTHVDVIHSYCKVGDFWLPERNETVAQVRIFGRSTLTIEYKDYRLIQAYSIRSATSGGEIPVGFRGQNSVALLYAQSGAQKTLNDAR